MQRQAKKIKFRLKNGKTPESWQLPIKGMMLNKIVNGISQGLKRIHYIPGISSVWLEDYKGDEKPRGVYFEKGLLEVDPDDKNLLFIIRNHKFLNVHFELADDDAVAQKELDRMDLVEKALAKVNIANGDELKANAMVLLGFGIATASDTVVRQKMKKNAFDNPKDVLATMNSGDYQAKYVAALSVLRGVVIINPTQTACSWEDGKVIVKVAAGQSPLEKLGEYLSQSTEDAVITLQEIGERITRSYAKRTDPDVAKEIQEIVGDNKDNELPLSPQGDVNPPPADPAGTQDEMTLEEATASYLEVLGKDVPNNKKNDLDWILLKIAEKKA